MKQKKQSSTDFDCLAVTENCILEKYQEIVSQEA